VRSRILAAAALCAIVFGGCESPTVYVGRRPEEERPPASDDDDERPEVDPSLDASAPPAEPDDEADDDVLSRPDAGVDPGIIVDRDAGIVELTDGGDWEAPRPRFQVRRCTTGSDCRSFFSWFAFCELTYNVCVPCFDTRCYDRKLVGH